MTIDLDHPRLAGIADGDVMRALATCAWADVGRMTRRLISSDSSFEGKIGYSRAVVDDD